MKLVIKVGGSLLRERHNARNILKAISVISEQRSVLVVPGGGIFADIIRGIHSSGTLSDSAAHWLAIKCMDLNAVIMAEIQPSLSPYSGTDAIERWGEGESFIIEPYDLLKDYDKLPHSWDVTSDSIALWLGIQGNADAVLLLKNTNPFMNRGAAIQSETEAVKPENLEYLVEKKIVDRHLVKLLPQFEGDFYVVNGRIPDSLLEIIERPNR